MDVNRLAKASQASEPRTFSSVSSVFQLHHQSIFGEIIGIGFIIHIFSKHFRRKHWILVSAEELYTFLAFLQFFEGTGSFYHQNLYFSYFHSQQKLFCN